MANNFERQFEYVETALAAQSYSGEPVELPSGVVGIAADNYVPGQIGRFFVMGVWRLRKATGATAEAGAPVFWDSSSRQAVFSGGTFQCGIASKPGVAGSSVVRVGVGAAAVNSFNSALNVKSTEDRAFASSAASSAAASVLANKLGIAAAANEANSIRVATTDFGVDNTGVTNCTTELLAFYNYCIDNNVTGRIPGGTYKLTPGVLVFDRGYIDHPWPHIQTDGYAKTIFRIDSATEVDAPLLRWSNGTSTSGAGRLWQGGSHGGLTIQGSGVGSAMTGQHGLSLSGMVSTVFGRLVFKNIKGSGIHVPYKTFGATNPDPHACMLLKFPEGLDIDGGEYLVRNDNGVGLTGWVVDGLRITRTRSGGWYGLGDGSRLSMWACGDVRGWVIDDGAQGTFTLGRIERNLIDVGEFDNCENGIRLNNFRFNEVRRIRFAHKFQTLPNTAANYWPRVAISLAGGTAPIITGNLIEVQHRIPVGGTLADVGQLINANSSTNVVRNEVTITYDDQTPLGINATHLILGFRADTPNVIRNGSDLVFSSSQSNTIARGSAATAVHHQSFGSATSKVNYLTVEKGVANFNLTTSTFTTPTTGWYRFEICLPLTLAVGTSVRMGLFVNGNRVTNAMRTYSVNAAITSYRHSGEVFLNVGETVIVTADQGSGAPVNCTPLYFADEVRFSMSWIP